MNSLRSPLLRRAQRLYGFRRFSELTSLLEPEVFSFRDNPEYYKLLGMACLHRQDFGGADTYLQRCVQLQGPKDPEILMALGCLSARRRQAPKALGYWLQALELKKNYHLAKQALQQARGLAADSDWSEWTQSPAFFKLFPGPRLPWSAWLLGAAALSGILVFLLGSIAFAANLVSVANQPLEAEIERLSLPALGPVSLPEGQFSIVYGDAEIRRIFRKAQELYQERRYNEGRFELNRLLISNADDGVKQRAKLLDSFFVAPDFSTWQGPDFAFEEVRREPLRFQGVYVRWRGRVANLRIEAEQMQFDLLVGYQDGRIVEGVVPVRLGFASLFENSQSLEVLAEVRVEDIGWRLEGRAVYRLP